jgi:hypothetical protein
MEKQLIISVPEAAGEDGLTIACKKGELFRNDARLENLYKQGYRVYNYSVEGVEENPSPDIKHSTVVKVMLKK